MDGGRAEPPSPAARKGLAMIDTLATGFIRLESHLHRQLVRHGISALRIAVGAVFLGFGLLKYFPGVSPAEDLVKETTGILTFGLVPDWAALVAVATLESFIGICLIWASGCGWRSGSWRCSSWGSCRRSCC